MRGWRTESGTCAWSLNLREIRKEGGVSVYYLKAQKTRNLGIVLFLYKINRRKGGADEYIDMYAEEDKEKALSDLLTYTSS